jgi:hypothetical protein
MIMLNLSCEVHQQFKYCVFKFPLQKFHSILLVFVSFTFAGLLLEKGQHFLQRIFGNIFLQVIFDYTNKFFMKLNKDPKAINWIFFQISCEG